MKSQGETAQTPSMRRALAIQFGSKYANVAIQLLVTGILARLLTPSEFGVVAIVTVFTTFFSTMADMGLSPAIVQRKDLSDQDLSGLLTFSLMLGLALGLVFFIGSGFIATVYSEQSLGPLCRLASVSVAFSAMNMVPNGALLRDRRFLSVGVRLLVATVLSGACAVILARLGFGAWSLIWQSVLSSGIVLAWNVAASGVRFGDLHFRDPLRKVLSYSLFQAGFSTVNYFSRNLDNMLIGGTLGSESLGLYDKAYKLTTYPISMLASVVGSTLQPYLSEYQNDSTKLLLSWSQVAKTLSLIAAPLSAIFFCCSSEVIEFMFGEQWAESVPLFHALSVSVYFQIVNNPSGALFQSSNHTDYMFAHSIVSTGITVVLLLFGLSTGNLLSVARCISLAYILHTASILFFLVYKSLGGVPWKFVRVFVPEVVVAIATCWACQMLTPLAPKETFASFIFKFAILVLGFVIGYTVSGQMKVLRSTIGGGRIRV